MAESLKMPAVAALGRAETKTAAIRRRPRRVYKTLCDRSTSSVSCARCSSISDGGGEGGHAGECGKGGAEVRGGDGDGGSYGDGREGGGSEAAAMMPVETAAATQSTRTRGDALGAAIGSEYFLDCNHMCNGYSADQPDHMHLPPVVPSYACPIFCAIVYALRNFPEKNEFPRCKSSLPRAA